MNMSTVISQIPLKFNFSSVLKGQNLSRIPYTLSVRSICSSISRTSTATSTNIVTDAKVDAAAAVTGRTRLSDIVPFTVANIGANGGTQIPQARYGGRHTVAMLSGDGVGPEMMHYVRDVFRLLSATVDFDLVTVNNESDDSALEEAILSVKRNGVAIKGNLETLPGSTSKNLILRDQLQLNTFVQRCFSFPGVTTRHEDVDIVIVRENSEGEYSRLEHENIPGVVESLKIITEAKSKKAAQFAFDYAVKYGRRKVTCVHKANIMKLADGLFLNTCSEVAKAYPQIEFNSMIIDNCCMQLVSRPQQFDVMLLPNLYGNIVGNVAAGLVGGPGLASGVNLGDRWGAVFETGTRNSGRSLAGKNSANPFAMLLTGSELLHYIGLREESEVLRRSIFKASADDGLHTADLGGSSTTEDVVNGVKRNIVSQMA